MARVRPFNREALSDYASDAIRPPMGIGALVWRYLVLVPLKERGLEDDIEVDIADRRDRENIQSMLVEHFTGLSVSDPLLGYGLRDPKDPGSVEINQNLPLAVYARPIAASDRYFDRLQQEMQEAFGQGVILIERQEAFLLGNPRSLADPTSIDAGAPPLKKQPSRRRSRRKDKSE